MRVRGAYDTVTVINSVLGPATRGGKPTDHEVAVRPVRRLRSAGSRHGSVVLSTLRNKNGPGNAVHPAGNTEDPTGRAGSATPTSG